MTVTVRNDVPHTLTFHLRPVLEDGSATSEPGRVKVRGYAVKAFRVTITPKTSDRETTGELVLASRGASPAVVPLVVEPRKEYGYSAALLIFVPLLAAAVLVILCLIAFDVNGPFGPANWDYSQSWATSLTLVGALLGTILGAGVLPNRLDLFSKAGYSGFNVLFGMLVLVAPLVYAAAQKRIQDAKDGTPQYKGTTWAFGFASVVTLWGVFGELATVGLLFREIEKAGGLDTLLVWASWVVLGLIVVSAITYTGRRMRQIAESPPADDGAGLTSPGTPGTWSLL